MQKAFWAIFAIVLVFAASLGPAASSENSPRLYSASISTVGFVGSSVTYLLTITNSASSTEALGSAKITVPKEYASKSLGAVSPPPGKTWTATLSGRVIELRNPGPDAAHRLAPGESVSVAVTVGPCIAGEGWKTGAKRGNTYGPSDTSGNPFVRVGPDPVSPPCVGPPHHLAFGQQPTNTTAGAGISPPVTVRVEDQAGNLVTSSSASIALAIGANPAGATLGGTTTRNAVGGIATFDDLSLSTGGTGYTLVASNAGLISATSQPFNVTNVTVTCPATGCTTSTSNSTTTARVTVPGGGSAGVLSITLDPATGAPFCGGAAAIGSITTVDPPGGYTASNPITVALIYKNVVGPKVVCKDTGPSTPFHVVPNCTVPQAAPCVVNQHQTQAGHLEIRLVITSGDPAIGTH